MVCMQNGNRLWSPQSDKLLNYLLQLDLVQLQILINDTG
jgi:hypothetical protein